MGMDEEQTRQVVRDELKGLDPRVRRRTILKVAGAAGLAGVLGGSAAGQTTSDGAQLDVGGVTTNTYRIAGNLYGGVDADKSELTSELGSADTGAKYRASDTKSYYHWDGSSWVDITPGGGSGAPTDAQYVTLALDGTLSDERTLNATGSLTQTDNGANSNVDLDVSDDGITATEIASGAVGSTQLATDAVGGAEINLSDIAGDNITVDATNDELDASSSGGSAVTAQEDDTDLTTDMALIDFKGGLTGTNPTGDEVDVTTDESEIDHDSLQNYVANEHVDHSTVSISSGTGLTGGGDITASRTLGVAANGVTGTEIDLSDIAGQNITVDGTNDELDASAGVSQVATGTVTATGGSQPAVDTTLANVSTTQTLDYWLTVHTESDPAFNADYAFNFDYYHQWDDSAGELDIQLIVNWDTDPGGGNDVTLRWEVLQ